MSPSVLNRSRLLIGCGSAALALGLVLGLDPAAAQGIQAEGNVVFGSAQISGGSNSTTVDVFTPTVVIDWSPFQDVNGNALTFLPNGSLASFQTSQLPNFAVLNRILPSTNGNVAVIDGSVISRVQNVSGQLVPGGFVAFYSPTGILIGNTATFDVGRLLLTTLDTSPASFQNFAEQGSVLSLVGVQGSTAKIQISPGAQILATPENAFFAVVAAHVEMRGIARVNGSHAYVAGEVVNLNFSNGLFDISVPVGTAAAGEAMTLDGTVGGPSSTGNAGDNHMIYAVARATADPISMLLRGNLGYDPAQSAGIVNGEIIISANHNVFGRLVDGGSISDGVNAVFNANGANSNVRADINIEDFNITSSLLAIGTHVTRAAATNSASSVTGNLILVGRERAELVASNNRLLEITGDVMVSAEDYGMNLFDPQSPASTTPAAQAGMNLFDPQSPASTTPAAQAGIARIEAAAGSITIGGQARVLADAFGAVDFGTSTAGSALGGQAQLGASGGGTLSIGNGALVSARGFGPNVPGILVGASARGGLAELFARSGGSVTINGNAAVEAGGFAAHGSLGSASTPSDAFGGQASIRISDGGGTIRVTGFAQVNASAFAQGSNTEGEGALADAGEANVVVSGPGTITIDSNLRLLAVANGGNNLGGIGGKALGGRASAFTQSGGTITIAASFVADASARAGDGMTGGDGAGGIAGAVANIGTIGVAGSAFVTTDGLGGAAAFGFGGSGGIGRGGNSALQATGTLTQSARLTVGQDAFVTARGLGGRGGSANADGSIAAGAGGDGFGGQFTLANQADPLFNSGAFILAGGDNGTIEITGPSVVRSSASGGEGGLGSGTLAGGAGGNGFGGLAQGGLALLGQNGSLGQGVARFGDFRIEADGSGGDGGFAGEVGRNGAGGNGAGGNAFLAVRAGDITAGSVELFASGFGGQGRPGGAGVGGQAAIFGSFGGTLIASGLNIVSRGFGGLNLFEGAAGNGTGGLAAIEGDRITVTVNGNASIDAGGFGGFAQNGVGGNGTGGQAYVATLSANNLGVVTVSGKASVSANGNGGGTLGNFAGGTGAGGIAYIDALGGGNITLASAQVHALGFGGSAQSHKGGDGIGGTGRLRASGTGSRLTIQNVIADGVHIIDASGIGATTAGGDGIGGLGRGGALELIAAQGGTLTLPASGLSFFSVGGFGASSSVEGGGGGGGVGGSATILVDGGTFAAGRAALVAVGQGGSSANADRNISGGNATGGAVSLRVINNGTFTMDRGSLGADAHGGFGSRSGNGGNATAQSVLFEIVDSTANLVGNVGLFNQARGAAGQRGGNALGGSLSLNAVNSQINLSPDSGGFQGLGLNSFVQGGTGVEAGGSAQGGLTLATLNGMQMGGGALSAQSVAFGGTASAATGTGGNVTGGNVQATITNSTLNLIGSASFSTFAGGGAGGTNGAGGSARSGAVDVDLAGSTLNIAVGGANNFSNLDVRTQASGGQGTTVGNANSARSSLTLNNSTVAANSAVVASNAGATTTGPGRIGGTAVSEEARLIIVGVSGVTANFVFVNANATSSQGGSARAGLALLQANSGATATIIAPQVIIWGEATAAADAVGGIASAVEGGRAIVAADGGSLTINGDLQALGRGLGANSPDIVTGATSRGGLAQLFARLGGSIALRGNLTLDASAVGANGSMTNASSVSNAFGGLAIVNTGESGGTINIGGSAFVVAQANGGSSNNAGAGSLADAGVAIVNLNGAGLINIAGSTRLDATARGGTNAGGTGGLALGGRASATTFVAGTIRTGVFTTDTSGTGGNGRTGGDGFGGIGGANALLGEIAITGNALASSRGSGGSATFGIGGNGGTGRGGNAFFQANGNQTQTARLSVTGSASASAEGFGGNGGIGDAVTAGGRGGNGFGGGQSNVPNQADPAFGSGAFLLAGGDNGTLVIGGDATAIAFARGGRGGDGGSGTAAGRGGDATAGLAQGGLALLGGTGALGAGSAQFARLFLRSDGTGGSGGTASTAALLGAGGNGLGGTAALTVRAGDVTATAIDIRASGFGGTGGTGGNGTGGFAAVFGSLAGGLSAAQLTAVANGSGGASTGTGIAGIGGIGRGGQAFLDYSGIETSISGDGLIEATGFGGSAAAANGGDGFGGTARIGTLGTASGNGNIAGNTWVLANGVGGTAQVAASGVGGTGTGGLAEALALSGGVSRFGSLQVGAGGRGGAGSSGAYVGGNGTGGTANLRASGVGSQLIVLRNTPNTALSNLNSGSILAANGFGGETTGGSGVGGTGIGGSINVIAQGGGALSLPATPFADPGSIGFNRLYARGFGGGSSVEGGVGGTATGGNATIIADGGTISMGETVLSAFSQGGFSLDVTRNITGGAAFGGNGVIRVTNGGVANVHLIGGVSGGVGGNGSGSGNGGHAMGGSGLIEVIGSTINSVGTLGLIDQSTGGTGQRGGNAVGDGPNGGLRFIATDATINFTPDANGLTGLLVGGVTSGGEGVVAGGNATGPGASVLITNTRINGGRLNIQPSARGGAATAADGVGGTATAGLARTEITGSTLALLGESIFRSDAVGGAGGKTGRGGTASAGAADVIVTTSTIGISAAGASLPGILRVQSNAVGGLGGSVGNATSGRAILSLTGSSLHVDQILVSATAFAAGGAGQNGGSATSGEALFALAGNSVANAPLIEISANALTSAGGNAQGGTASLQLANGSTGSVTAAHLRLQADASGEAAGSFANTAGQFSAIAGGGSVNAGSLTASATGDSLTASPLSSEFAAVGGNLNVSGALNATAFGDILLRTAQGGIIGNGATANNAAAIRVKSGGTIQSLGDGSTGSGLAGNAIELLAGRSVLLGSDVTGRGGAIMLTANGGGGQALGQAPASVITMTQGSRIEAGTGTVTVRLLDGAGDPQRPNGAITLASISAGRIDVRNLGTSPGGNIAVRADSVLTASGTGRAIDLASLSGEVINLAGDAGLVLTGSGYYGIFAATPTGAQIGSFANYGQRYNVANAAAYDALNPGGNFAAFRIAPVITVTANDASRFYGSANPLSTASFAGFMPGDGVGNLSGTPLFSILATGTSNVGTFAINAALGSLLSEQGYQFSFNPGVLTITARPITVTANSLMRIYGNANPALTFSIGGLGLVNGDQLTGALVTTAGVTTGVGNMAITQGTLAADPNYLLTFVDGVLAITPRPITLTADNLSKLAGRTDPDLTFVISGEGLVNGDQLSGGLVRDPGEAVGPFAIRQGTLAGGPNYTITYAGGVLTITAPPTPPEVTSSASIAVTSQAAETATAAAAADAEAEEEGSGEEEDSFGMDFPSRADVPLISEDTALDDPVSSGGDASLYSGDIDPAPGNGGQ